MNLVIFLKYLVFPIITFFLCLVLWLRFGRDPKDKNTIIPEFAVPAKLSPIALGSLINHGNIKPRYITAALIDLAVKRVISIEEIPADRFLSKKDYFIRKIGSQAEIDKLDVINRYLLESILPGPINSILVSRFRDEVQFNMVGLKKRVKEYLVEKGLFSKIGFNLKTGMLALVGVIISIFYFLFQSELILFFPSLAINLSICMAIIVVFAFLMPQLTFLGANVLNQIYGFKLYMQTAERYRSKFNDKENIFDKFLPYAIVFNMTHDWAKKMRTIYGKDYVQQNLYWYNVPTDAFFHYQLDIIGPMVHDVSKSFSESMIVRGQSKEK